MKHLLPEEEITETVRMFAGRKKTTCDKHLLIKAFIRICLEEKPEAITPNREVLDAFQRFCRAIGLYDRIMPSKSRLIIKQTGLTNIMACYIRFTETRTWRGKRQVRAYKGIALRTS